MHRPRRTAEFMLDHQTPNMNLKSANRPSRIAQPLRRPSTRERSTDRASSADRVSGINKYISSTTKRQRSSTCITPQRTPTRQTTFMTASKVPMTAEKQRAPLTDKKWIQEQSIKIVDYLKCTDILGKEFFNRGNGLKTISTKHFIIIINYLLKFISGSRFTVGNNHVEELPKILENLNYPYSVAKSWLKTPSAPHSIGNVILLLNWLLSFNPQFHNDVDFQQEFQLMSNEFPNFDYEKDFRQMTRESFDLWNNQKNDEYEMMKKISIDKLIESKTGLAGTDAINDKVNQLNIELKILNKNRIVIEDENELIKLKNEFNTKTKLFETQEKSYARNKMKLNELGKRDVSDQRQINDLELMIGQIEQMVKEQKYPVELRNQLIEEVDQLNHFVSTKSKSIDELKKNGERIQLVLSRIVNQTTVVVSKFNNFIRELFTICHTDLINEYKMDEMLLNEKHTNKLLQQIVCISSHLQQIFQKSLIISDQYKVEIAEIEKQLKKVSYENENMLKPKSTSLQQMYTDIQKNLENTNHKITEIEINNVAQLEQILTDLSLAKERNSNLQCQLIEIHKDIENAHNLNKAMLARIDEKMNEVEKIRSQQQKDLDEAIDNLGKALQNYKMKFAQKDWNLFIDI